VKKTNAPRKTPPLLCGGCGKPIVSEPGGLDHAKIAKALGSDAVYHLNCHPKGRMVRTMSPFIGR
jgi:hypothetical protein